MTFAKAGVRLIDCVHKTPTAQIEGYPYVGIPQMKNGRIEFADARLISEADFIEWTKKAKPQPHDVILSRRTNPGVIAIDGTDTPFALGQNLVILRADGKSIHPPFLRWLCLSPSWWEQIEKYMNVGAVFSSLRCGDVPNFELPVPPINEQREIAAVLGALDDKIELNRKTAATLEAMARALYRSWFVDFDPVTAKSEGRAPAHMPPTTASLFPDRFGDDGLPEGWRRLKLRDITDKISKGTTPRKADIANASDPASINFLKVNAITDGGEILKGSLTKVAASIHAGPLKRSILEAGDVVFSIAGTIGRTALITEDYLPSNCNQAVAFLRPMPWLPSEFLWVAIDEATFKDSLLLGVVHAVQANLSLTQIGEAELTLPDEATLLEVSRPVCEWVRAALHKRQENQTLATLRDTLLPRLMSGELRVGEARDQVEAVA